MKNRRLILLMLLFSGAATAQVDWSLSSNFVSAAEAGGPALGLADPVVRDIQEDGKGRIWFATQKGVSCYDGKTFKSYLNTPSDSLLWKDWGCHFLTADATGRIWLATTFKLFYFYEKKDGFVEYDLSKVEPSVQKDSWMAEIYLLDLHDEGSVWFRKNDGVYAIDARSLAIRKALTIPLEWRSVSGLLGRDNDGLFWAGGWLTKDKLALFQRDGNMKTKLSTPFDTFRDMFQQPGEHTVWLGANNLASYDKASGQWGGRWSQAEDGHFDGLCTAPKLTHEPILWMYGIGKANLLGFDMKKKRFAYKVSTLEMPNNPFRCGSMECLFADSHSNLWLGGREGVSVVYANEQEKEKWDKLEFDLKTNERSLSQSLISGTWDMPDGSIAEWVNDGDFYTYIALSKSSKAYFEGQKVNDRTIAGQRIFVNTDSGERTVSKATYTFDQRGYCFEKKEWETSANQLVAHPPDKSKIVVCRGKKFDETNDVSGTWNVSKWLNLYYFQDSDFLACILPEHFLKMKKLGQNAWQGKQVRTYGGCRTEMEVRLNIISSDSIHGTWTALDGLCDLQKGQKGNDGVKRYKVLSENDSIFISEFRIFNEFQPIVPGDYVSKPYPINHAQNFISFDFASTADPDICNFYYMLEGFDKDWFLARAQRTATYTNLDGGSYVFKVKAVDVEGTEMRSNARFMLRVRPPFYKTWWFILGAALISFFLIRFIFRYRLRQQLEKEAIRLRIARDLHDEVGSTLTTISILSESVLRQMELDGEKARLSGIGDKARTAMSSMSDIVWSVNPQNDSMDKIVERMIRFATDTLEPLGISAIFDIEKEVYALQIPMEQRKDFYLFFKEATTNVAKHSGATRAVFFLKKTGRQLLFTIEDDGKGLPPQPQGSLGGNGLRNMRARAEALGAQLEIKTEPNSGVLVSLRMPTA
ncbi:MAG: hypothetical protein KA138_00280 [Saprospiraceae bacterium]|nr:hypothetical protein [Saprospiraceae bacterium]